MAATTRRTDSSLLRSPRLSLRAPASRHDDHGAASRATTCRRAASRRLGNLRLSWRRPSWFCVAKASKCSFGTARIPYLCLDGDRRHRFAKLFRTGLVGCACAQNAPPNPSALLPTGLFSWRLCHREPHREARLVCDALCTAATRRLATADHGHGAPRQGPTEPEAASPPDPEKPQGTLCTSNSFCRCLPTLCSGRHPSAEAR